jgi:hypothetical protein
MSNELSERISCLSDDELLKMITIDSGDYRQEAVVLAAGELQSRGFIIMQAGSNFEVVNPDGIRFMPLKTSAAEAHMPAPQQYEPIVERAGKTDPFIKRLLMSPVVFVCTFIGGFGIGHMITQIIRLSGGSDIVGYRTNTPIVNGYIIIISILLGAIAIIVYQIRFTKRKKANPD